MRFEAEIIVPQNTRLYVGRIEEQASYKGGADQILLPKDYPSEWIRTIRDLKTGKVYTFEEYMRITIKYIMHGRIWIQKHRISLFKKSYVFY